MSRRPLLLRWTPRAIRRLDEVGRYISASDPAAAFRVLNRIVEATRLLIDHPEIGRPGRVAGTRELVLADVDYIVPYRVREDVVEVLSVMHTARRWPDRF